MAHPSSADADTHERGLDEYRRLGGNCIHLRPEFFLCTQICHEGWDETARRAIDHFTPAAVSADVATDLELLGTDYLDLVYLDDSPRAPLEPVIEALRCEMASGRVRAVGVRNWTGKRIRAAHAYASACIAAVVTTELALAVSTRPLWPEYIPFDGSWKR